MTRQQLMDAINAEASSFLGFKTAIGMSNKNKAQLEGALIKLQKANKAQKQAREIQHRYTREQWEVACTFGVGQTGVSPEDISKVNDLLVEADNLWMNDLFAQ